MTSSWRLLRFRSQATVVPSAALWLPSEAGRGSAEAVTVPTWMGCNQTCTAMGLASPVLEHKEPFDVPIPARRAAGHEACF